MQDRNRDQQKIQQLVDLIQKNKSAAPVNHIQYGGVMFNIHPGANIGPITTVHHYPDPKKESNGH